jgi:hypothetical protein
MDTFGYIKFPKIPGKKCYTKQCYTIYDLYKHVSMSVSWIHCGYIKFPEIPGNRVLCIYDNRNK